MRCLVVIALVSLSWCALAQQATLTGRVLDQKTGKPVTGAIIYLKDTKYHDASDVNGKFLITQIAPGKYVVSVQQLGWTFAERELTLSPGENATSLMIVEEAKELDEVIIEGTGTGAVAGIGRLQSVEGSAIYEAKKTEVIVMSDIAANLSTNNSRQVYAKVPGLNIWESDGAGLQLGIAARGLDPNRTSNFNVRQNGYDISADALGYPESYYTPPTEAIDRIEVVRGAASLQYGTQFGGLLNFRMKTGPTDKKVELTSRQSLGSFGLFNSFNSIGGTIKKVSYYTFYQHKQGDGWRPNSEFDLNMAYSSLTFRATKRLTLTVDYTYMKYLAKQPGGLTDQMFYEDPRQSTRSRNWFQVDWNLAAVTLDYQLADTWKINSRTFALIGGRDALGNLKRIDRPDDFGPRDLFVDDFTNFGNETRLIHNYTLFRNSSIFLTGVRYYHGLTHRRQGEGSNGDAPDFEFSNPDKLEGSDFDFPGNNLSFFVENIFSLNQRLTFTPGLRWERIQTKADGYYSASILRPNPDTGMAEDSVYWVAETKDKVRSFLIAGLGVSYRPNDAIEWYGNISQNYRAINFNDIRVVNQNLEVDPDIHDERGYNADLGIRGTAGRSFNFDVSVFYLAYKGRISSLLKVDSAYRFYRYRTNAADSRHVGLEAFFQYNLGNLIFRDPRANLWIFNNISLIDAHYINSQVEVINGNKVELVPPFNYKAGLTFGRKTLLATLQASYTSKQYSDATNAEVTPTAVEGAIPAYFVMDFSSRYSYRWLTLEAGVNNLLNEMYFTRRAVGYPGPGILPSDGRNFYVTLQAKIGR
jgi:Fe(3+) dicitrate transport protein